MAEQSMEEQAKIKLAKKIVGSLGCVVMALLLVAMVLGAFHCYTERPAKEIFFPRDAAWQKPDQ